MARTINVDAEVYVHEVLENLSTDDLADELVSRRAKTMADELADVGAEIPLLVERLARPKWSSPAWCQRAYDAAMGR